MGVTANAAKQVEPSTEGLLNHWTLDKPHTTSGAIIFLGKCPGWNRRISPGFEQAGLFTRMPNNSPMVALELGRRNGVDMGLPVKIEKGQEGLSQVPLWGCLVQQLKRGLVVSGALKAGI